MNPEFLQILWGVDAVLAFLCVVSIGVLLVSGYRYDKAKLEKQKKKIILRKTIEEAVELLQKGSPEAGAVLSKVRLPDWLEITRQPEKYIPEASEEKIKMLLRDSKICAEAEIHTCQTHNKWNCVDRLLFFGYVNSPGALKVIQPYVDHPDEEVRYYALLSLARLQSEEAVKALFDALNQSNISGQKIISLIDSIEGLQSEQILRYTQSPNPKIRFWILKLLSTLLRPKNLQLIFDCAQDDSPDVRAAACECFSHWKAKEAKEILLKLSEDAVWFVRMRAVRALGEHKEFYDVALMVNILLRDSSVYVKESAKTILSANVREVFPHLLVCMRTGTAEAQQKCVELLVEAKQIPFILRQAAEGEEISLGLLKALSRSGIYFGLKRELEALDGATRAKVLDEVRKINPKLANEVSAEGKVA